MALNGMIPCRIRMMPYAYHGGLCFEAMLLVLGLTPFQGCWMGQRASERYVVSDSIVIPTGFPVVPMRSGVFTDKAGREYLYFGDPVTRKKLKFFTEEAILIQTVDLVPAMDSAGDVIGGISVLSWDSIVMNSHKGERLVFFDTTGRVFRVDHLEQLRHNARGDQFDLGNSGGFGPSVGGQFIFVTDWTANDADNQHGLVPPFSDRLAFSRYYNGHRAVAPHLARVDLKESAPQLVWGVDSFYFHMREDAWRNDELPRFGFAFGKLLIHSIYSPTIQVVEPTTFTTVGSWMVRSDHTETCIPPPVLDEPEVMDKGAGNRRLSTMGHIYNVVADRVTGHYLVVVLHTLAAGSTNQQAGPVVRPASVIEFDGDFRLLHEAVYDDDSYSFGVMFPTSKGVLVLRRGKGRGTATFDRIVLHEE